MTDTIFNRFARRAGVKPLSRDKEGNYICARGNKTYSFPTLTDMYFVGRCGGLSEFLINRIGNDSYRI